MADASADHERFTRLFLRHEPEIFRAILPFVPHRADAREVLQETAVALWRQFATYDLARPFAAWACGFARVEVLRFLRGANRRRQLTERAAAALLETREEMAGELGEQEAHLRACLDRLPAAQRALIEGYYLHDRPVDALARDAGRTAEAVYKILQRARRALAECVRGKTFAEADHD
jgi:RNA polymerase sigma-70 factor (ECF subfamily)